MRHRIDVLTTYNSSLGLDSGFPWLQSDLESFGTFQDDISLQPEVRLLEVRPDSEIPQDGGEDDLQLEHGVFASYAGSGSSRERNERVVVTVRRLLRQEVVRVEDLWVRVDVRLTVHLEGTNYHRGSGGQGVVTGN